MQVISHDTLKTHKLPGLIHQTLSSKQNGNKRFEVWKQTISGESATPVHKHNCEEVIVILKGAGECWCEGKRYQFQSDQTLVFPPNVIHQIINTGKDDLEIMATLSMSPVIVETEEGGRLPLPWDTDRSE